MVVGVWGGCVMDHGNEVAQVLDMAEGTVDEVAQWELSTLAAVAQ